MENLQTLIANLVSPDNEKRNRSKFFFLSLGYDTMCDTLPDKPYEKLSQTIAAGKPARVLDYCSGTGYTARSLARLLPNSQIEALDISPEMLAVAKERSEKEGISNIRFHEASAAKLPFENNALDAVCISLGLHELPPEIRNASLVESFRVLKPGGAFYAMDLDRPAVSGFLMDFYLSLGEPPYARDVLTGGVEQLLRQAGFTIVQKRTWMGDFLQFVEARKPQG
ncbi:MAG: class I SAM-dependent methyltransferase [Leptospiraceae bacterium]|nr:class I SAM-dependent methyltransferase [Leptospiraceae bacterium]